MEIKCKICPNMCDTVRNGRSGVCRLPADIQISHTMLHKWEEPVISGTKGSGAVFFTGCTLKCVFCQNYKISRSNEGKTYTPAELADLFRRIEDEGAHNVNLVSGTPFIPDIAEALEIYKPRIPVVWNSSGYELPCSLKMLEGKVDVYLPDFKYSDDRLALKLSGARSYLSAATAAISEMIRQVPSVEITDGLIKRGVIVRHLVLPSHLYNSIGVVRIFSERFKENAMFSLMAQYTPFNTSGYPEIDRPLKPLEYKKVLAEARKLGITEGYLQDVSSTGERFVPEF